MTYKTGQRFKAKIKGDQYDELLLKKCQSGKDWWDLFDKIDNCIVCIQKGDIDTLERLDIHLEILPDADEPKKGDLVEVSGDGNNWQNIVQWVYTGGQTKFGNHIVEYAGIHIGQFKHIRLALSPEKIKREEAKQKAEKFMREHMPEMEGQSYGDHSKIMSAIALYILKEKM